MIRAGGPSRSLTYRLQMSRIFQILFFLALMSSHQGIASLNVEFHNLRSETVYLYETAGTFSYVGDGIGRSGFALNAGASHTFTITSAPGAKIGFSVGETLVDQTLQSFRTPTAPDYYKRFDKVELNVPSSGAPQLDLTATDFFSVPVHLYDKSSPSTLFGLKTGKSFAATLGDIINGSGANTAAVNTPSAGLVTGGSHGVVPTGVNGFSSPVVRMVAPSTVFSGTPAAYGSFNTYVSNLRSSSKSVKVKRAPLATTSWDFSESSWTSGADSGLQFTGGSLTVGTTTYDNITLTVKDARLTSDNIYLAANAVGMTLDNNTITGSDLILSSSDFSTLSQSDIGDSSEFLFSLNGFLEDLYVGFQLGAWGGENPVPEVTTNIPVGGEAIAAGKKLGELNSGQLLTLGHNFGDQYFFGNAGTDFYNQVAEVLYSASNNSMYGFPYSDFLNQVGNNPLLQSTDGGTVVVEILSDTTHPLGTALVIPEPSVLSLLGGALFLVVFFVRRFYGNARTDHRDSIGGNFFADQ